MSGGLIAAAVAVSAGALAVWAARRPRAVVAPYRAALGVPDATDPTLRATVDGVAVVVRPVLPRFGRARVLLTAAGPPPGVRISAGGVSGPPDEVAAAVSSEAHERMVALCHLGPHDLEVRDGAVWVTAKTAQEAGVVVGAIVAAARALTVPDLTAGLVRVATTDADAARRREAFAQLGRRSDARRVAARALREDPDPELRVRASHVLGDAGPAEALALSGEGPARAVHLARTVAVMRQSPAWREIVAAAAASGEVARVVAVASGLAFALGEAAESALDALARHADAGVRRGVAVALGGAPEARRGALARLARDPDPTVQEAAKGSLGAGRRGGLAVADAGGLGLAGGGELGVEEEGG